jgi:hypothetical protein
MPYVSHDELMRKYLAEPEEAVAYLNVVLEDGHPGLIAHALNLILDIHGTDKKFRIKEELIEKLADQLSTARIRARFEVVPKRTRRAAPKTRLLPAAPKPRRTAPKRTRKVEA